MKTSYCIAVLSAGLLVMALPAWAQEKDKIDPVGIVRKHIDGLKFGKGAGALSLQGAASVKNVFPDYRLVIARFRLFPVARIMPEGLHASNIFAVNKEGKLEYLKDVKTLEKFCRAHCRAVKNQKDAKTLLAAWLTLTPEFYQDGFFKFDVREKEFTYEDGKARGSAIVMSGGNGELKAVLHIDKEGKLAKAEETGKIRPGPRPICQATKLLDADPIVRRIAEQDLLIMGLSARDYLMEQRERATPQLRDAIDRLWRQIQRNGW